MLVGSREKTSGADNLPAQTIVVFNAAVPETESLANFTRKNADDDHLVEPIARPRKNLARTSSGCLHETR
jgi:hypothetical protein